MKTPVFSKEHREGKLPAYSRGLLVLFAVALLLELFFFNFRFWDSLSSKPVDAALELPGLAPKEGEENVYWTDAGQLGLIRLTGFDEDIKYLYLDIVCYDYDGNLVIPNVQLFATDEGHALRYHLGDVTPHPAYERTKYHRLYLYGRGHTVDISFAFNFAQQFPGTVEIREISLNKKVPMMFSWQRFLLMLGFFFLLYLFRPSSRIYHTVLDLRKAKQKAAVCVAAVGCTLLTLGSTFLIEDKSPGEMLQYHHLAEAFADGHTHLNFEPDAALLEMDNPYDYELRRDSVNYAYDYAFYEGKYYVYTGVIPEILLFFPYYMVTGKHLPRAWGIRIPAILVTLGVFYLMYWLVKRFFADISVGHYLLMCFAALSSFGLLHYTVYVDGYTFYTIPTVAAIACALWGIGLWLHAAFDLQGRDALAEGQRPWHQGKTALRLAGGSLLVSFVAGCRPQLILVAVLAVPLFLQPFFLKDGLHGKTKTVCITVFFAPVVVTAAALMYYNHVRFGSPFDFGIRYLLTRNDMMHSGWNMGRLWDGFFSYLFQPFKLIQYFPFTRTVSAFSDGFDSAYLGEKLAEPMYGGAFFLKPFLLAVFAVWAVRNSHREKRMIWLPVLLILSALIVIACDTEVGGILYRYVPDFLWLLALGACMICLLLWQKWGESSGSGLLTGFVLLSMTFGMALEFFRQIDFGLMHSDLYYRLLSLFV